MFATDILVIYLCFQIYFLIDHQCLIQSEFSDIREKDRIDLTFYRVLKGFLVGLANSAVSAQTVIPFGTENEIPRDTKYLELLFFIKQKIVITFYRLSCIH